MIHLFKTDDGYEVVCDGCGLFAVYDTEEEALSNRPDHDDVLCGYVPMGKAK